MCKDGKIASSKVSLLGLLLLFTPHPLPANQHWPLRQGHNRFLEHVKLICLKETAVTSSLSAIKRGPGEIQLDEMSCDS